MNSIAYFGLPGGSEVILILFIILLLFGAKKLPELSRALGRSLSEFKKGKADLERELREVERTARKSVEEVEPEPEEKADSAGEDAPEVSAASEPAKEDRS